MSRETLKNLRTVALCIMIGALIGLSTNLIPQAPAQKKTSNAFANRLDAGEGLPCMHTRLYYTLNFGPNGDDGSNPNFPSIAQSRPFFPVQVNERGVVDGVLFVTNEDTQGTQFQGQNVIFIEGVGKGNNPGQWKFADLCLKGDPTPFIPPDDEGE